MTTASPPPPGAAKKSIADKGKKKTAAKSFAKSVSPIRGFFASEVIDTDVVDEVVEKTRIKKVIHLLQIKILIIAGLALFFLLGGSFIQPDYQYYAMDSSSHRMRLLALSMPNMTNKAVLSWATNSITEILTFGFGDYNSHLSAQQPRFTPEGWESFANAFIKTKIGQLFKERQLVLTTVPSDTAVIVAQGPPPDRSSYEWKIQVPVVMTYATNDNVTHHDRGIVTLVVTRVPTSQDPTGIAIKTMTVGGS